MKLLNLRIQAFRGIRDSHEFNFGSPLTVLYGPNGTGKTSICHAVEWLLTGQIFELGPKVNTSPADLCCSFQNRLEGPKVRASLSLGQVVRDVGRHVDGPFELDALETTKLSEKRMLNILAPDLMGENVHGTTANNICRNWLRGTRFLSGGALALLLDSAADSNEKRQQIFADLLGTRALMDTSGKIKRYCAVINPEAKRLRTETEKLTDKIRDLRGKTGDTTRDELESQRANCLVMAAESLRKLRDMAFAVQSPEQTKKDYDKMESRLRLAYEEAEADIREKQSALDGVEAGWSNRIQLERTTSKLPEDIEETGKSVERIRGQLERHCELGRKAQETQQNAQSQLEECRKRISLFDTHTGQLNEALSKDEHLMAIASSCMAGLCDAASECQLEVDNLDQRLKTAEQLASNVETWGELPSRLKNLRQQEAALTSKLEGLGDRQELSKERDKAKQDLDQKRSAYKSIAGSVDRIRQAVNSAMPSLSNETKCPTCGTDFNCPEHLAEALKTTLEQMPDTQAQMAAQLSEAEKVIADADKKVENYDQTTSELRETRVSIQKIDERVSSIRLELKSLGLEWHESTASELSQLLHRLRVAKPLQSLREDIVRWDIQKAVWECPKEQFFERLRSLLTAQYEGYQKELEEATKKVKEMKQEADAQKKLIAQSEEKLSNLRKQYEECLGNLRKLRRLWENVAGSDRSWSEEALTSVKQEIENRRHLVVSARKNVELAQKLRESLQASKLIEKEEQSLETLSAQLKELETRLGRAETVREKIDSRVKSHSQEQIQALLSVVSPLFMRLQANRVIDNIQTGENPLEWLGKAGEHEFDPAVHFSQGQRQDLALAIFLARARALGGTYFLDEPLAHLDDLNRVALLDALRVLALEKTSNMNLVITTANRPLVRHLMQKFARIEYQDKEVPPLKVYEMEGNPRVGLTVETMSGGEYIGGGKD